MQNKSLTGEVETMQESDKGRPGRDIEAYTYATKSEYHLDHEGIEVDLGTTGHRTVVIFTFIVNAANVRVAKFNNDLSAYGWIREHTVNNVG